MGKGTDAIRKQRLLFNLTERLMRQSGIEVRDTWKGYDGENYDDYIAHGQKSGGPRLIKFAVADDDQTTSLITERYELPPFQSLAYENSTIVVPKRWADKMHPYVHEAVHFLQHNTIQQDDDYFRAKSNTPKYYKQFVSQRAETEAYFIQLLFMSRYELEITNQVIRKDFNKRLRRAIRFPAERVGFICWAHWQGII